MDPEVVFANTSCTLHVFGEAAFISLHAYIVIAMQYNPLTTIMRNPENAIIITDYCRDRL